VVTSGNIIGRQYKNNKKTTQKAKIFTAAREASVCADEISHLFI